MWKKDESPHESTEESENFFDIFLCDYCDATFVSEEAYTVRYEILLLNKRLFESLFAKTKNRKFGEIPIFAVALNKYPAFSINNKQLTKIVKCDKIKKSM